MRRSAIPQEIHHCELLLCHRCNILPRWTHPNDNKGRGRFRQCETVSSHLLDVEEPWSLSREAANFGAARQSALCPLFAVLLSRTEGADFPQELSIQTSSHKSGPNNIRSFLLVGSMVCWISNPDQPPTLRVCPCQSNLDSTRESRKKPIGRIAVSQCAVNLRAFRSESRSQLVRTADLSSNLALLMMNSG